MCVRPVTACVSFGFFKSAVVDQETPEVCAPFEPLLQVSARRALVRTMAAPFALRMEGGSLASRADRPGSDEERDHPLINSNQRSVCSSLSSGSVYVGLSERSTLHPSSPSFRDCTFNSTECFETCIPASATAPSHHRGLLLPKRHPMLFSQPPPLCASALEGHTYRRFPPAPTQQRTYPDFSTSVHPKTCTVGSPLGLELPSQRDA